MPAARIFRRAGIMAWAMISIAFLAAGAAEPEPKQALLLEVKDAIGPAVSDFVVRGIEEAERTGAEVVIIRMDTPGGLDAAMRDIIQKIASSSVPIVTYVAPSGARAASAGTYIMYASHVAAMAPATNLGSATPVQIVPGGLPGGGEKPPEESREKDEPAAKSGEAKGVEQTGAPKAPEKAEDKKAAPGSAMERKTINDAVAYIRGFAKLRGRNEEWAEKAVREAANLTAEDALAQNVIDLVAPNLENLLEQLHGRSVKVGLETRPLETAGLDVRVVEPDWRSRILAVITNPNVAYILMLLGVYGLFFELYNPGAVLPGVVGAISLLLALYAFQVLPINYAGLALIFIGIAFMVGEMFVPSFGALGIGGGVAFVAGSLILMETDLEGYTLSRPLVLGVTALTATFFLGVLAMALRHRRKPAVTGQEQMIGDVGEVIDPFDDRGHIRIHGEVWMARTPRAVTRGERVRVRAMEGLMLIVEPLDDGQKSHTPTS